MTDGFFEEFEEDRRRYLKEIREGVGWPEDPQDGDAWIHEKELNEAVWAYIEALESAYVSYRRIQRTVSHRVPTQHREEA